MAKQLLAGAPTLEEVEQLLAWKNQSPHNQRLYECWMDQERALQKMAEFASLNEAASWSYIVDQLGNMPARWIVPTSSRQKWLIAAALLLLCWTGGWFFIRYVHQKKTPESDYTLAHTLELPPGKAQTVLSFADGTKLALDSLQPGPIINKAGIMIDMPAIGKLTYSNRHSVQATYTFNRLDNSSAKQCQLVLPDGTEVWLNAASSLRYPTFFADKERIVELTGQAYFKVAQNPVHPFKVRLAARRPGAGQWEIEVLGTSFDCADYKNEQYCQTILLEGAVKLSKGGTGVILTPSHQAIFDPNTNKVKIDSIKSYSDWRDSLFRFSNTHFLDVLQQVSRWYNVEFICSDQYIKRWLISANIHKNKPIDTFLKVFQKGLPSLQYRHENKRIWIWHVQ